MSVQIKTGLILCFLLSFSANANNSLISFLGYQFDPLVSVPDADTSPLETSDGEGLFFVQFSGLIKQQWLDNLKNQNMEVLQYYPNNTYLVWGQTQNITALESQNFVRWSGSFARAYRKSPNLKGRNGVISNVNVHFYNNGSPELILDKIKNGNG
ncbi:MAG: hypothetical protein L3J52_02310 [Proteobacteria bacterium]|nr:hypothetical protein [Pseudomonadota bacterium]